MMDNKKIELTLFNFYIHFSLLSSMIVCAFSVFFLIYSAYTSQ